MPILPISTVLIGLGALTGIISVPLLFDLVPPNRFYGIRLRASFASEQSWYAINRFGGKRFLLFSAEVMLLGFVCRAFPDAPFWLPISFLFLTLLFLGLAVGSIQRYAKTIPGTHS
jgi:uncharacterized membrane protein